MYIHSTKLVGLFTEPLVGNALCTRCPPVSYFLSKVIILNESQLGIRKVKVFTVFLSKLKNMKSHEKRPSFANIVAEFEI